MLQTVVCGVGTGERLAALFVCEQMGANMCEWESRRCALTELNAADTGVLLNVAREMPYFLKLWIIRLYIIYYKKAYR